jgi:hypothetical protein
VLYRLSYVGGSATGKRQPFLDEPAPTSFKLAPLPSNPASLSSNKESVYGYRKVERVMGIEPTPSAWKAEVLPLNYTRLPFS